MSFAKGVFGALAVLLPAQLALTNGAWATSEILPHVESQLQQVQEPVPFDGTWEGNILFDKEAFLASTSTPPEGVAFRFEIHGPVVQVFIEEDGKFGESKPGAFHIAPVGTNAVIFATDSAPDAWVETWTFVVTQKDDHTLTVEYTRLVNNVGSMPDSPEKIFGTRGIGDFKLVPEH